MRNSISIGFLMTGVLLCCSMCRKSYTPSEIRASNHFLTVDGFINTGINSASTFIINRSLNLLDSVPNIPELGAAVSIQVPNGPTFPLTDNAGNGTYVSAPLSLDPGLSYQLAITTSDGNQYLSDLAKPKSSPPIDSLTWQLADDPVTDNKALHIFVNAHDPTNNTRYYRWDYIETYEHASFYESNWYINNDSIYPVNNPTESRHICWITNPSASILLGSSINLTSDVISQAMIASFAQNDPKMDIRYSILVRQYPLDLQAYTYWLTVQKNSQSLGGLFDIQPAQIRGNIHSITHPGDPVAGYISACSPLKQRLFIDNKSLGWKSNLPIFCPITIIASNPANTLIWNYADTSYSIYYFNTGSPPTINATPTGCVDCRYSGGTNLKPPFWQ